MAELRINLGYVTKLDISSLVIAKLHAASKLSCSLYGLTCYGESSFTSDFNSASASAWARFSIWIFSVASTTACRILSKAAFFLLEQLHHDHCRLWRAPRSWACCSTTRCFQSMTLPCAARQRCLLEHKWLWT